MLKIKDILNIKLEDDNNVEHGGISFEGETVENFYQECEMDKEDSIEKLNEVLRDCGIKEINSKTIKS